MPTHDAIAHPRLDAATHDGIMTALPRIYLTREAERLGTARELRALFYRGHLIRIATGAYVDSTAWAELDDDAKYRLRVRAAAMISSPAAQFSHDSAAALWMLPSLGPWSPRAHELVDRSAGGSSRVGIARHALGLDPDAIVIDGVLTTSLARTLVDVGASNSLARAVAMIDDGMRIPRAGHPRRLLVPVPPTAFDLLACLDRLSPYRGATRARRAIAFARAESDSPLESFARVQFAALGYPEPELQVRFEDEAGVIGYADFYWRELGLIVEADGEKKYGDDREFQTALSLRDILLAEKAREDRMRRQCRAFSRIGWRLTSDRRALAAFLRPHGLEDRSRGGFGGARR